MAQYMLQFAYTAAAWSALSKKPEDRAKTLGKLVKRMGGKLGGLYYTMGEYDGVAMMEAPDDTTAMAIVVAALGPGHVRASKTTRLYSMDEMLGALKLSKGVKYEAPKG
jgi:uncharacterized protein with GYD domain